MEQRKEDISKKILFIILIIIIFISIVGTWTVLNAIDNHEVPQNKNIVIKKGIDHPTGGAVISINILPRNNQNSQDDKRGGNQ